MRDRTREALIGIPLGLAAGLLLSYAGVVAYNITRPDASPGACSCERPTQCVVVRRSRNWIGKGKRAFECNKVAL